MGELKILESWLLSDRNSRHGFELCFINLYFKSYFSYLVCRAAMKLFY